MKPNEQELEAAQDLGDEMRDTIHVWEPDTCFDHARMYQRKNPETTVVHGVITCKFNDIENTKMAHGWVENGDAVIEMARAEITPVHFILSIDPCKEPIEFNCLYDTYRNVVWEFRYCIHDKSEFYEILKPECIRRYTLDELKNMMKRNGSQWLVHPDHSAEMNERIKEETEA